MLCCRIIDVFHTVAILRRGRLFQATLHRYYLLALLKGLTLFFSLQKWLQKHVPQIGQVLLIQWWRSSAVVVALVFIEFTAFFSNRDEGLVTILNVVHNVLLAPLLIKTSKFFFSHLSNVAVYLITLLLSCLPWLTNLHFQRRGSLRLNLTRSLVFFLSLRCVRVALIFLGHKCYAPILANPREFLLLALSFLL